MSLLKDSIFSVHYRGDNNQELVYKVSARSKTHAMILAMEELKVLQSNPNNIDLVVRQDLV